ncbi:hypothetical protein CY34DRAFT_632918 [Suillus luteus UH-Slu-Lm8-n1]|uniref:Uncharacterized protein n=1 Tax=Suillus luteus UH-Slu-Lm8-n1 TaxID=930992 RepID=A0A0D0B305_9AGAM|nr:hypothetical protein CY34DRAFT_632918 [Suillus luteus UH-Slu-Lm8-n1]
MRLTHRSPRAKGDCDCPLLCGSTKLNLGLGFYPLYVSAPKHLHWALWRFEVHRIIQSDFRVSHRCVISVPLTLASCASLPCVLFALPEGEARLMGPSNGVCEVHGATSTLPVYRDLSTSLHSVVICCDVFEGCLLEMYLWISTLISLDSRPQWG